MNCTHSIEGVKGSDWLIWPKPRQRRFVLAAVRHWRAKGFPYYRLTDSEIDREVAGLVVAHCDSLLRGTTIISSTTGLRLANFFHPQMWHVRCTKYCSPYDTFQDDAKLAAAIERALTIWPDRCGAGASCLRRILKSFSNTVGVSNFRPSAAKALISRYCAPGGRVLDFCAGYGGRLLGSMALNRSYLGIDCALEQVQGLRKMVRVLRHRFPYTATARIIHGAAEDEMRKLPSSAFDLVFSSPPYFNREKYSLDQGQSFLRYPDVDLWRRCFLGPLISESSRLLKEGGYLVINVHNRHEPLPRTVRQCAKPPLQLRRHLQMQLARLPYKRKSFSYAFKTEPILVFTKLVS